MARTKTSSRRKIGHQAPSLRSTLETTKKPTETLRPIVTNMNSSHVPAETPSEPNSPTTINTSSSLPKRSVRAASEAITKREQEKKRINDDISPVSTPVPSTEKKPALKKKRKLNTKKVVMVPSSSSPDELALENTSVDSYSKYLNPKEGRVAPIVIDIKKRKMVQRNNKDAGPSKSTMPIHNQYDSLDLSHHSILPNESYVAHISLKRKLSVSITVNGDSDESSVVSAKDESSDEYFDALSEFEDETMEDLCQ